MNRRQPIKIGRDELIVAYYIEELKIREIASRFDCEEETVRRLLHRHHLLLRDREWPEEDVLMAGHAMLDHCEGRSMELDVQTMVRSLLRRRSAIIEVLSGQWLRIFAPNVDVAVCPLRLKCMNRSNDREGD